MIQYFIRECIEFANAEASGQATLRPLYMTCSSELLHTAQSVQRLLSTHYRSLLTKQLPSAGIEDLIAPCFQVFHEYLWSILPQSARFTRFRREHYVNYSSFLRLWDSEISKQPNAKKLTPDTSWHIIRTYIKGMRARPDEYLDPDEYPELPRKRKSVSDEQYKKVYDIVWDRWYRRLCEEKLWDDQDLAAAVLADSTTLPRHPVICCDESQDFTPLEIARNLSDVGFFPAQHTAVPLEGRAIRLRRRSISDAESNWFSMG